MKVLQINSVCGIRSTGRICTDLAEILESHGHECKIAYGREHVPEKYEKYAHRIGSNRDVLIHAFFSRIFDNSGFMSKRATKKFVKWIREYNPDIIHLHNIHGYYINIEVLFKFLKEFNKPVVWTMHDCWAFTGHCSHFDYVGCSKWQDGCHNCSQKKEYPSCLLMDGSKRNYKKKKELLEIGKDLTIITPSLWLAGLVRQSFVGENNVEVINNGIDLSIFRPVESNFKNKYKIQDKKMLLGVASVWNDRKGFDTFLKLAEKIDKNTVIVMVGVNDSQLKILPENIIGIKRTNSTEELAKIYSAADVFINPTMEDTFPTTNLEALACGTPVITYKTGGSVESITDECGIVVSKGDIDGILKCISELNCSTSEILNHALKFNRNDRYEEYINLYMRCLK